MSGKRELLLVLAALLVGTLAYTMRPESRHTTLSEPTHPLLVTGLKEKLNAIDTIEVSKAEEKTTIVKDQEGMWHVKERYDYPASVAAIRKTLLYLSQSELREKKTDDPQKLSRLGLDAQTRTKVTLKQGDAPLFTLAIGNPTRDGFNTYVQPKNDAQSYVASGRLEVKASPSEWLFYDLFSIARSRVKRIRYTFKGKKNYEFVREKAGEYMTLLPKSDDVKLKDRPMPLNPSYYFERLEFTDVLPASRLKVSSPDVTVMEAFDGLVLTVHFAMIDDREWAYFDAAVDPSLRDAAAKDLMPLEKVHAEADAINQRATGWLYELGQFNHNQLRSSYYDLVTH